MNESLGIFADLQAKRASIAESLSPAARHAAFPKVYARPLPKPTEIEKYRSEVGRVQALLATARAEINRLKGVNERQAEELSRYINADERSNVVPVSRKPTASNVVRQFLIEYNAVAIVDGTNGLQMADLMGPRRSMFCAQPRQVAMWLCHGICRDASLPMIGKAFGGKDHTTVLHAKRRAPGVMERRPDLRIVADRVLAHFGDQP
jgi:hypothetical protein